MVELPAPPSLDPDGSPEDPASSEAAAPTPVPAPIPAAVPAPAPAPPEASLDETAPTPKGKMATQPAHAIEEPRAVPAPGLPPESTDPAGSVGSGVQDSVEEVLQQTSAQTLQLSHLEDILTALNQTLTDLQDEMHAGFAEIRAVTESAVSGEGTRRTEVAGGESLTQRFEFVEEQTVQANKRQSLLTILAIAQGVLLIILLIVVMAGMRSGPTTELPDADYTTSTTATDEPEIKKPPPVPEEPRKKKRRRKR